MQNLRCSSHKKYKCIAVTVALQEHPVPMPRLVDLLEVHVCKPFVQHHARPPVQFDAGAVNSDFVTPPVSWLICHLEVLTTGHHLKCDILALVGHIFSFGEFGNIASLVVEWSG